MPHRAALLPALFATALLAPAFVALAQPPAPAELKANVQKLAARLGDPKAAAEAEWGLLRLGPDALPLLPKPDPTSQEPAARRLRHVAATLKELLPRTFTFSSKGVTVDEALAALAKQTGIEVKDLRIGKGSERFPLECKGATFWQALDEIAKGAKARLSFYQPGGKLALVSAPPAPARQKHEPPPEPQPISYHGMFRTAVNKVTTTTDLVTGMRTCHVELELAWEPRWPPFLLDVGPATVLLKDRDQAKGGGELAGEGRRQVTKPLAEVVVLHLPESPRRALQRIDGIAGRFVVTAPSKMLDFTFPKLSKITSRDKPAMLQQEGVEVKLTEVTAQRDGWTVEVVITNPPPVPHFDSHLSWLGNNAVWLEKGPGKAKVRLLPAPWSETERQETAQQATVRYRFTRKDNPHVRPADFDTFDGWSLLYRTPGQMVEITVPYSFRGIPLP